MLNLYILIYLLVTLACMGTLVYVMIRQYREVRRPRNAFTQLRWRLFWLPTIILFGLGLGLPRLYANLHEDFSSGQLVRIVGGIIVLVGITALILGIYTFKERK
jgi:predicted permease